MEYEEKLRKGQAFNLAEQRRTAEGKSNDHRLLFQYVIEYYELAAFFQKHKVATLKEKQALVTEGITLKDLHSLFEESAPEEDPDRDTKAGKGAAFNLAVNRAITRGEGLNIQLIYSDFIEIHGLGELIQKSSIDDLKKALFE